MRIHQDDSEADLVHRVLAALLALAVRLALLRDVHHGCCGWEHGVRETKQ